MVSQRQTLFSVEHRKEGEVEHFVFCGTQEGEVDLNSWRVFSVVWTREWWADMMSLDTLGGSRYLKTL